MSCGVCTRFSYSFLFTPVAFVSYSFSLLEYETRSGRTQPLKTSIGHDYPHKVHKTYSRLAASSNNNIASLPSDAFHQKGLHKICNFVTTYESDMPRRERLFGSFVCMNSIIVTTPTTSTSLANTHCGISQGTYVM